FGHNLYEAELRYLVEHEWVVTLEDAIWRRTKLGMWLDDVQRQRVADWLVSYRGQLAKAG
ncbi:MAG: glycerol-3-phosphate dehydrogenase C-terminal domain-containing protein, partial [Dickeya sp.]